MRSVYPHCLPTRSGDRPPSDGSTSPLSAHPPNDSLHSRSILCTPNLLHTPHSSSQQHPRPSHHSPLTPRLDMFPPRQIPNSLYSTYNDSPISLATQYARGQASWMPRVYESRRQQYDPSHHINYHRTPRDLDDYQKRNSLPPHVFQQQQQNNDHFRGLPRASSADVERDRQARACGQPPPPSTSYSLRLDCTSQQNTLPFSYYHMPHAIRRPDEDQRQRDPKTTVEPVKPQAPRPEPNILYSRLDKLVRRDRHRAMDHILFDDVLDLHRQEVALQEKIRDKRRGKTEKRDPKFRVIGAPLRDVLIHASSTVTIGEHQHDVPTIVVACVEELSRTGIYQQGLFRTLPSRDRYIQLIDIYNLSADYGAKFSMHKQTMPDICAVLSTFISSLPHPLLDPRLYNGFWHWCVKPSIKREEARRNQQDTEEEEKRARGELPLPTSAKQQQQQQQQQQEVRDLHVGNDGDIECHQIMIAQIILRFLPIGQLSLLIYLCGFFTQLPLCPENGIEFEDIARIYGTKILGGTVKVSSQKMMVWLLSRWCKISEGLLTDACGMSQSQPSVPAPTQVQEELPTVEDTGGGSTGPLLQTRGSRRSRSSDSDRSSYSGSSSPRDQAEPSTSTDASRYRKKRSIESTPESDHEAPLPSPSLSPSRSRRPSRRNRLGRRNSKKSPVEDLQGVFSKAFAKARASPASGASPDPTFPERTSGFKDTPDSLTDRLVLEARRVENELRRNNLKTFKVNINVGDEVQSLSEKVEQLERTLGERKWHNPSASESKGLVTAAG
ncbi:hypothetical protein AZE42_06787 [Rhizopogon vesiculosus]|uniref:Rho-GAP domain-containing protein n=1 Tax=Rhizopogon vesiculosus TaxID=180088 RepID=A0A1J8RDD4_9AGAM|nr:hypothetical protein AZE42_06787 [Rhizopogon vesiculosus]